MIRNAVIHIANEQPLVADLLETPKPDDLTLLCTNLRTLNGTRPVFVDASDSLFVFPFAIIRFIEIPAGSRGEVVVGEERPEAGSPSAPESEPAAEPDLEIDEDFLRRVREV